MIDVNAHILLIYTGGTIGMVENPDTGSLEPFDFAHLNSHLPELQRFRFQVDHIVFSPVIDSSDITPEHWKKLVHTIENNYNQYDGFVILHGTDTMAYTASALSFMIENLHKPIVLTGAQLPIGKLRTDAKENLITALEIAADKDILGNPIVPEVCVFFQNDLLRGNRSTKVNADNFNAFKSYNYPNLAKSGIQIRYDRKVIHQPDYDKKTVFHYRLDNRIGTLKLFPGIDRQTVEAILTLKNIKAIIMETYGSGNAPLSPWFIDLIRETVKRGVVILNITQCNTGMVDMQRYETGRELLKAGVISGSDATFEAAITKLMFLIGHKYEKEDVKIRMKVPLIGEITRPEDRVNERV
ncbi:L-asparaginase [Dysgonomonas sp. PFB1-18]|uniref:asparaginase n=1 Tax=unclassified Dysgonomonas TaxID=2630389 RepID=UPI002475ADAE|nr:MULTISPECIES: asparaginase [unclassified Dysgonomonas]MDH6310829.1 L-asparaginase [Dysgonomonas sp. PF1-14]MDH6340733.1 L-asparaginase [Dysgonomonas sp. PF1-16]MDH6382299.1 L-asparaginase [Dysgonomonas sp. PFB1-18]MDH6399649.1 L-asparaginase [Dysgonomonas sp. PF1-23]